MRIFAIDTSSKYFSLVVARDGKIIGSICEPFARELSRKIIPAIDKALRKSGVSLKDIDCFAVGIGPGSFTGLRIGLATVKGMLFPYHKPLVAVSSLDVVSRAPKDTETLVCPIIDAKRGLVYSALYRLKEGTRTRKSRYLLVSIKDLLAKIPSHTKVTFLGDGILLYRNDLEKALGARSHFITDQQLWYPQADNLLKCVQEKIDKKEFSDVERIAPLYLYPKECQIKGS